MDVHLVLNGLIGKGVVRPSVDSPRVYAPVDLDTVIEGVVNNLERELREIEMRRQELKELQKRRFQIIDDLSTF
jgi:hypothetical protein